MNIYIENLIKEYTNKTILNVEKLEINSKVITGIIGPNGAGKSTLLHILAMLEPKTSGQIHYLGKESFNNQLKQNMTLVFQNPYLIKTTVENNIAYPLKIRGWDDNEIEKRVNELADNLGLGSFLKRKAWQLSGGETQKVALARALSFRPKLLLLDEPTTNIDTKVRTEIEDMLIKINKEEETTILIVTHNLSQAKKLCNKLIL